VFFNITFSKKMEPPTQPSPSKNIISCPTTLDRRVTYRERVKQLVLTNPHHADANGFTLIMRCIALGDLELIKILVEDNHVNVADHGVLRAVASNAPISPDILQYLIDHGLDIHGIANVCRVGPLQLLHVLCQTSRYNDKCLEPICVLIRNGANVNTPPPTPLELAIAKGNTSVINLLIAAGAHATSRSFWLAAINGCVGLAYELAEKLENPPSLTKEDIEDWYHMVTSYEKCLPGDLTKARCVHETLQLLYDCVPTFELPPNSRIPYEEVYLHDSQSAETDTITTLH
jgi:ankyrin repeat protein